MFASLKQPGYLIVLKCVFIAIAGTLLVTNFAHSSETGRNGTFLFYMHGRYLEQTQDTQTDQYLKVMDVFSARGFNVVGEVRKPLGKSGFNRYAGSVAKQVRRLIERGVPATKITVAGHSKGGMLAMTVSSMLGNDDVNFVVLAGCGFKGREAAAYRRFASNGAKKCAADFLLCGTSPIGNSPIAIWQ